MLRDLLAYGQVQGAQGLDRLPQPLGLGWVGALQPFIEPRQRRRKRRRLELHHQAPGLVLPHQGHGHLQPRGDQHQQRIGAIALLQRQPLKATARLHRRRRHTGGGQQRRTGLQQIPELRGGPHPTLELLQQGRFIEGGQGRRQPHAPLGAERHQKVVLEGGQGCPPLAPHAVLIAAAWGSAVGQFATQGRQTSHGLGGRIRHHQRPVPVLRRRATDAHSPRAMKFTSMAERP